VFPSISKIIFIFELELLAGLGNELADVGPSRIEDAEFLHTLFHQQWIGVLLAADLELMQRRVGPSHRRLDMLMKFVERAIVDLNPALDGRTRLDQRNLELEYHVGVDFDFRHRFLDDFLGLLDDDFGLLAGLDLNHFGMIISRNSLLFRHCPPRFVGLLLSSFVRFLGSSGDWLLRRQVAGDGFHCNRATEEQQVDSIPIVADDSPFLPADESEVAANRQQKIFARVN
jgi:hypothetical protein